MKLIIKAITEWLQSDATLVSLTGHSTSDIHIAHFHPDMDSKRTGLVWGFLDDPRTLPVPRTYLGQLQFVCTAPTAVSADDIGTRVRDLIAPRVPSTEQRQRGVTFDTASIRCFQHRILYEGVASYNSEKQVYEKTVGSRLRWLEL